MILADVLHILIEDGMSEARHACLGSGRPEVLQGMLDGYEACRGREPADMRDLLLTSALDALRARETGDPRTDYYEAYDARVRFVAAVMSCALSYHGLPPLARITFQARARYASIVGYDTSSAKETNGVHPR